MNVLIIPEDFRKDQYILKPIVTAMLEMRGVNAKVKVCQDPLLGGVTEALKWERLEEIVRRYPLVKLFLLCVDRDGQQSRRIILDGLEKRAANALSTDKLFLAENAWQEIEVWVLAGHDLPSEWNWQVVRAEPNPKEIYFLPFVERRGLLHAPGEGRKTLAYEAARRYSRIAQLCPEVAELAARITNP